MKKTMLKSAAALIFAVVCVMLVSAFFTACGSSDCVGFIEKLAEADSFTVQQNGTTVFTVDESGLYWKWSYSTGSCSELYLRAEGGEKLAYEKESDSDAWVKEKLTDAEYIETYCMYKNGMCYDEYFLNFLEYVCEHFEESTVEVDGKYKIKDNTVPYIDSMTMWIDKGMLYMDIEDEIYTVSKVGKTKVEYPNELKNATSGNVSLP